MRAARCCSLPDFRPRDWEPYRLPIASLGTDEPEDIAGEGCPGGWAWCGFTKSLQQYRRPRGDGVFSANVLLDRCDDPLVLSSIVEWERQLMASEYEFHETVRRST